MMLGSVFNRYQASTSSEPSRAPQTKLRILKIGKDTYPFSEFRGLGPPEVNIGLPGDIYIDITPGFHALYARYTEIWSLWPGPKRKDASKLLLHPLRSDRCLWCNDTIGWFSPINVRANPSGIASELLSETLRHQATLSEESKKRKRNGLGQVHQPIRTKPPMTNTSAPSPTQKRTALENQDASSFSYTATLKAPGYSQPSLEIMLPDTHISTNALITPDSEYYTGPSTTDSYHSFIPTDTDHIFTEDLSERSERNLEARYTSPKRIDLRKIAVGGAKRPSSKLQRRRASSPTNGVDARSVSLPIHKKQSLPQLSLSPSPGDISQPSVQGPETSSIYRNYVASPDQYTQANPSITKEISFNFADATRESFMTKGLHDFASLTSINWNLPHYNERDLAKELSWEKETQDNGLILDVAIAELSKIKDASDTSATYLQAANDKIRSLEAENAKLRARLLNQCQCSSMSCDNLPMVTNVDSDTLNETVDVHGEADQSQRESAGPCDIVRKIPSGSQRCYPSYHTYKEELDSSSAPKHSSPSTSLFLAGTSGLSETESSIHTVPAPDPTYQETSDIVKIQADTLSSDEYQTFRWSMNASPLVEEKMVDANLWHASPVPGPMSSSLGLREIHRSVLFAKAGSSLICRICLGTKLGGVETVDQAFQVAEDSPELMQEHCENEHPSDCEALVNLRDDELLELVSMISTEC